MTKIFSKIIDPFKRIFLIKKKYGSIWWGLTDTEIIRHRQMEKIMKEYEERVDRYIKEGVERDLSR